MDPAANSSLITTYILPAFVGVVVILTAGIFVAYRYGATLKNTAARAWFAALLAAVACIGTVYVQRVGASEAVTFDVDMLVSEGNLFEVYLNEMYSQPKRIALVAGRRNTYQFGHLPARLTSIRLDPTETPGARIVMYGIRVHAGAKLLWQAGPTDLRNWNRQNASMEGEEAGGLVLKSISNDPVISGSVSLALPTGNPFQLQLTDVLVDPHATTLLTMIFFLIVAACGVRTAEGMREGLLIAVVICTANPVIVAALRLPGWPPPVRASVGYAAYNGYPKSREHLAAFLLVLFCLTLAYLCYRFARPHRLPEELVNRPNRSSVWIAHAAVLLFLCAYFQPNLRASLSYIQSATYGDANWDDVNGMVWNYLVNAGLRPFRDFWYPYTGFYAQALPLPTGPLVAMLYSALPLWFFYLGLFYVTGRRLLHTLAVFLMVLIPALVGNLPASSRYLLAADVAFLYISASSLKRFDWTIHVPFTACTAFAFFCEPTQVAYGGIGILVYLAATLFPRYRQATMSEMWTGVTLVLKQQLRYAGIPMLTGVALALLLYAAGGMLRGLWELETSISDLTDYSALPSGMVAWVYPELRMESLFLFLFLLMVCTAYRYLCRQEHLDELTPVLLMLGGIGFLCMQKQIMRPHVMLQVGVYAYIGLLLYGLALWRERTHLTRLAIVVFLGIILGIATSKGVALTAYRQTMRAAAQLADNIDTVLHRGAEIRAANAARYTRGRFSSLQQRNAVVDVLASEYGWKPLDRVYVLSDDALFYILLGQQPPYLFNTYNTSPIFEQERILRWLRQQQPRFVLWAPEDKLFDTVPQTVRLPLIYDYVVRHYAYARAVGRYHILTALPAGQPPDAPYWSRILGDSIDLAHVPRLASLSEYKPCTGNSCEPILVVRYPSSRVPPAMKTGVAVRTAGRTFWIRFDLSPQSRTYVVHLERLWFWSLVAGASPRFEPADAEAQVSVEPRVEARTVLY